MAGTQMVFAFIFVIILIGFIFAFALPYIQNIQNVMCKGEVQKVVKDIETKANEVYNLAEESGDSYKLIIPSKAKICFVAEDPKVQFWPGKTWKNWDPDKDVIDYMLRSKSSQYFGSNIWIYFCDSTLGEGYKIEHLKIEKSFCAISGKELYFENKGFHVEVTVS